MNAPDWRRWTPSEIRSQGQVPYFESTLPQLVAAYTDVVVALLVADREADHPHPGEGAELARLALGAEIARNVSSARGVGIRAARTAGATWREVADALDVTEAAARDEFAAWINGQSWYYARSGIGLDPDEAAAARCFLEEESTL